MAVTSADSLGAPSRASRSCGLKSGVIKTITYPAAVTSFTLVWIKMRLEPESGKEDPYVTSFTLVWIKIFAKAL